MIRNGYVRKPEFIEDDFISGLETALTKSRYRSSNLEISRVSQDAEHSLGYDGVLTSLVPFYIQFKVSDFCLPQFDGATTGQRSNLGLSTERGYFRFKLHKDKNTGRFAQHNALFTLGQSQRAAYVTPMFYRKQDLTDFKARTPLLPWAYEDHLIYDFETNTNYLFRASRAFASCMTIQPHREIVDRAPSHYYSFSKKGEAAFHSDPEGVRQSQPLYNFLNEISDAVSENRNRDEPIRESLLKNIADVYDSTWESRGFLATVRSILLDLGLYPQNRKPNVRKWVFDTLETHHVLLMVESLLMEDFNIIQYIGRQVY